MFIIIIIINIIIIMKLYFNTSTLFNISFRFVFFNTLLGEVFLYYFKDSFIYSFFLLQNYFFCILLNTFLAFLFFSGIFQHQFFKCILFYVFLPQIVFCINLDSFLQSFSARYFFFVITPLAFNQSLCHIIWHHCNRFFHNHSSPLFSLKLAFFFVFTTSPLVMP